MAAPANFFLGYLSTALAAGTAASSIVLDRVTTLDGQTIETSDFADLGRGVLTVNPEGDGLTSYPENISFTTVTAATKTLSGAVRGLSKAGVTTTSLMRYHPVGTPVILSFGSHQIEDILDYVNAAVSAAVVGGGNSVVATAGETIAAAGTGVYLNSDGKWWKWDADTIGTVQGVQLGITQGAGAADATITNGVLLKGLDSNQSGLVAGTKYFASNTAGGISSSAGTNARVVGVARSSTALYFDPNYQDAISIQNGSYVYAADSVGTDAYAITVIPAIGSYVTGQIFYFKAGTANTGAATLAVSGLAAKTIKKNVSSDLATGDILQNQIVAVIYDGTNFQVLSKLAGSTSVVTSTAYNSGSTSKNLADASSATQTIAHGLGVVPTYVRLKTVVTGANTTYLSEGVYQNAKYTTQYMFWYEDTSDSVGDVDTAFVIKLYEAGNPVKYQTATVAVDATNITLTWTKTSTPTGTIYFLWEAEGPNTTTVAII